MAEMRPQTHEMFISTVENGQKIGDMRTVLVNREIVLGPFCACFSLWSSADQQKNMRQLHISNRLAGLRDERGVTLRELATALNLRQATLQALEAGTYTPTLALALCISSYFSLALEDIFSLS